MVKKLRVCNDNFPEFQMTYGPEASKAYASYLKNGEDFFVKKLSFSVDEDNLYTNENSSLFNA